MCLGLTVRGTIATELVCMRKPVVCAGHPPYENFIPGRIVCNLQAYKIALTNYRETPGITDDEFDSMLDYIALSLGISSDMLVIKNYHYAFVFSEHL